jgi:hypothetical protein
VNAYELKKEADIMLTAYKALVSADKPVALSYGKIKLSAPYPFCPYEEIKCDEKETEFFRTIDGTCNNLKYGATWWGSGVSPFKRLLPSAYDDDVSAPRIRSIFRDQELPNPRTIAMKLFQSQKTVSEWSQFMTYFGQFVDHDITLTEQCNYRDGYRKLCPCGSHDLDCFNIPVPGDDSVNGDQKCLSFVRSTPSVRDFNCFLGPREQVNLQTSWIDLSNLYGWTPYNLKLIRGANGTLLFSESRTGNIFPKIPGVKCPEKMNSKDYSRRQHCYITGL